MSNADSPTNRLSTISSTCLISYFAWGFGFSSMIKLTLLRVNYVHVLEPYLAEVAEKGLQILMQLSALSPGRSPVGFLLIVDMLRPGPGRTLASSVNESVYVGFGLWNGAINAGRIL
eukprot:1002473-Amorphochlora_amoeboformis.AAC.1